MGFQFDINTCPGHLTSDHDPAVCEIDENIRHFSKAQFDYSKANWNKYRRIIEAKTGTIPSPNTCDEIDNALEVFTKLIVDSQAKSIPTKIVCKNGNISFATKKLIQTKNAIKRKWQRTHTEPLKNQLKREMNLQQKQINANIRIESMKFWNNQLNNISKGSKKLWNLSKKLRGKYDTNIDKIKINNQPTFDDNCSQNDSYIE